MKIIRQSNFLFFVNYFLINLFNKKMAKIRLIKNV